MCGCNERNSGDLLSSREDGMFKYLLSMYLCPKLSQLEKIDCATSASLCLPLFSIVYDHQQGFLFFGTICI